MNQKQLKSYLGKEYINAIQKKNNINTLKILKDIKMQFGMPAKILCNGEVL